MERVIFHCDCNSFFASVELLHYPQLRDVPVAVCGDPTSRHGVILAKKRGGKALWRTDSRNSICRVPQMPRFAFAAASP